MLVNIFGKRGAGKTTMIRGALSECKGPVVVLDLLGNFAQPKNEEGELIPPFYQEFDSIAGGISAMRSWMSDPKEENKIIVIQAKDPDLAIDFISKALWENHGGTLVIDEADGFSFTEAPNYDWVIRYGRNRGVDVLTGCRRPAEISRNITAGANRIYAFRTQEPRDIEYFKKTDFGDRAEELMRVEPYSGLYLDYDSQTFGRFKIDREGRVFILTSESVK